LRGVDKSKLQPNWKELDNRQQALWQHHQLFQAEADKKLRRDALA